MQSESQRNQSKITNLALTQGTSSLTSVECVNSDEIWNQSMLQQANGNPRESEELKRENALNQSANSTSRKSTEGTICLEEILQMLILEDQWDGVRDFLQITDVDGIDLLYPRDSSKPNLISMLIKKMPDVAKEMFNNCITKEPDKTFKLKCHILGKMETLRTIADSNDRDLICHPLVINIVEYKWNNTEVYSNVGGFILYGAFLGLYTTYILSFPKEDMFNTTLCVNSTDVTPLTSPSLKIAVLFFCCLELCGQSIIWFCCKPNRLKCVFSFANVELIIHWILYILVILTTVDNTECQWFAGAKYQWQYNVASVAIFLSWINLLIRVQLLPTVGVYLYMLVNMCKTLITFLTVLFICVLSFSLGFYTLLPNHLEFASVSQSMVKTFVMMTGEFEFIDIFNIKRNVDVANKVNYLGATYFLFILFGLVMNLLVVNLIIGLSVYDVSQMKIEAKSKRYKLLLSTFTVDHDLKEPIVVKNETNPLKKYFPLYMCEGYRELKQLMCAQKNDGTSKEILHRLDNMEEIILSLDQKLKDTTTCLQEIKEIIAKPPMKE